MANRTRTKKNRAPRKIRAHHKPTDANRELVRAMVALGLKTQDIAETIDAPINAVRQHYRKEIDAGKHTSNALVAQSLFRMATDPVKPNVAAAIFWLKARAGWREADVAAAVKKGDVRITFALLGGRDAGDAAPSGQVIDYDSGDDDGDRMDGCAGSDAD